jgi:hypothetical protein
VACNRCEACGHVPWLSCRWDACELGSVLATGVTPMSLFPWLLLSNLGAVLLLRHCLGLGATFCS